MRPIWLVVSAVVISNTTIASAKLPDPLRSSCAITGQGAPCQFRFRADGGLDGGLYILYGVNAR